MTMRMSADDQFKFLLSCVKWSVNGKVDFQEVASECGVVSKGAAAKRYERMLKNHGIHPNGGPLDSPTPPREKSVTGPKAAKKRKCEDVTGIIKQDEDEERNPSVIKRPRNEQHHEIKQEPPPMTYPPYMFHPMLPPHGPYQPRLMPPYMHQAMPHGQAHYMQHPPHLSQSPYPIMPGMHNNHQFLMPLHQTQSFSINQNMPTPSQDSNGLGSFDDFCNQDFGNGSFESLLHGEPAETRISNEVFSSETPSVPQEFQQTSTDMQPEKMSRQIKAEPCQSLHSPVRDAKCTSEHEVVPLSVQDSMNGSPVSPNTVEPHGPVASNTPAEVIPNPPEFDTTLPFKQENDGNCIFISD